MLNLCEDVVVMFVVDCVLDECVGECGVRVCGMVEGLGWWDVSEMRARLRAGGSGD